MDEATTLSKYNSGQLDPSWHRSRDERARGYILRLSKEAEDVKKEMQERLHLMLPDLPPPFENLTLGEFLSLGGTYESVIQSAKDTASADSHVPPPPTNRSSASAPKSSKKCAKKGRKKANLAPSRDNLKTPLFHPTTPQIVESSVRKWVAATPAECKSASRPAHPGEFLFSSRGSIVQVVSRHREQLDSIAEEETTPRTTH